MSSEAYFTGSDDPFHSEELIFATALCLWSTALSGEHVSKEWCSACAEEVLLSLIVIRL